MVTYLTWNPPRQQAATAASELPGNELATTQNIAVISRWVSSELRGTYVADSVLCNTFHDEYATSKLYLIPEERA